MVNLRISGLRCTSLIRLERYCEIDKHVEDLGKNPAGGGGGRGVQHERSMGERTKPMRVVFKQTTGIKHDDMMDMNQSEFSSI